MQESTGCWLGRKCRRTYQEQSFGEENCENGLTNELKTDLQFMIDHVRIKECQLNLQLASPLPCVPAPKRRKLLEPTPTASQPRVFLIDHYMYPQGH